MILSKDIDEWVKLEVTEDPTALYQKRILGEEAGG